MLRHKNKIGRLAPAVPLQTNWSVAGTKFGVPAAAGVKMKKLIPVALLLALAACGGSPAAPSAPTFVNAAGLWNAVVRVTSASGGECVGVTAQAFVGASQTYTLQITQNGSNLSAVATSTTTGNSTTFSGTAGTASIALNATSSTNAITFGYLCSNGQRRDVQLTAATINANLGGSGGNGTYAETNNVYFAGTQTGVNGGIMTMNASFSMTR